METEFSLAQEEKEALKDQVNMHTVFTRLEAGGGGGGFYLLKLIYRPGF